MAILKKKLTNRTLQRRASNAARTIAAFESECRNVEYTDTDKAWELFGFVRRELQWLARQLAERK